MIVLTIVTICVIMLFGSDALDRYERERIRWERRQQVRETAWEEVERIDLLYPA